MSQVNLNPVQGQQPIQGNNASNGAQHNPNLPQELQNARPSTSGWSTFGRVVLGVVRVIGAIATIGISELIIRKAMASPEPPQPRVPRNQPALLPQAQPRTDADNTSLVSNMRKLNLPQPHLDALKTVLTDLAARYGDNAPKTLEDLRHLETHKGPFILKLEKLVSNSEEYVDPARLQRLAREILEPEMARRAVGDQLQHKAQELGMQLRPEGIKLATELLMRDCAKKIESLPMGVVTDTIENFLNPDPRSNAGSVKNAYDSITKYVDVADVLGRAALQDGLEAKALPPAHQTAVDNALKELRSAYGQNCLPTGMKAVLLTRLPDNHSLSTKLNEMAAKTQTAISPEAFAQEVKNLLKPVAQHHALSQALGTKLEKDHGLQLHPKVFPTLLDNLLRNSPDLKNAMPGVENAQSAQQALEAQKASVDTFLKAVADNVRHMEETYLPQVQAELRPILQSLIHSLPFDPQSRAASDGQLKNLVSDMRNWQASIPLGDPSLNAFCIRLTEDVNIRTQRLAGQDGRQFTENSNIATSFRADVSRNVYKFNGKVFDHKPEDQVIGEFTQMVPTAIDQQFLSKLSNQYLWKDLTEPLLAQVLLQPGGDPAEGQRLWRNSGAPVQEEARNNGLTFNTTRPEISPNGNFSQPQDVGLPNDGYFSITVSDDKKTAVVEMVLPQAITTEGPAVIIPVGTVTHTMQVTCELSGGDPNVKPRVTGIKLGQELRPLNK